MSIGSRLRQLRKANKLSGDKFGELCGVTKGMVSQWESDGVTPPTDRLIELHKHLDFSFDWLLNGKNDDATAYTTSDPTLIQILKVLEPRAPFFRATALKAVVNTLDAVDHASAAPTPVIRERTVKFTERRRALANASLPYVGDRRKKDAS